MESNIPVHLKMDWNPFFTEALYETITFPVHRKLSSPLESGLEGFFEGSLKRNHTFRSKWTISPFGPYNIITAERKTENRNLWLNQLTCVPGVGNLAPTLYRGPGA